MFLTKHAVATLLIVFLDWRCVLTSTHTHPVQDFAHFLKILLLHGQNRKAYVYVLMTSLFEVILQGQMTDKGLLSNILFIAYHTDTYSLCKNSNKQVAS